MNQLLLWMSARQSGSGQSFRTRVAEIDTSWMQERDGIARHRVLAWTFSKLGHAEFGNAATHSGWRVAPPVLAASERNGMHYGVLCGARTDSLLANLMKNAGTDRLSQSSQPGAPDVIELKAESARILAGLARDAGIVVQWNASLAILAAYPPVHSIPLVQRTIPVGGGWEISRFSRSKLSWVESDSAEAHAYPTGLFRFRGEYATDYVLKAGGIAHVCDDSACAKYRILTRRHRPISYSAEQQELSIDAACRPPALVERALVIASGRLPIFRNRALIYQHIDRPVAQATASVLAQRLY